MPDGGIGALIRPREEPRLLTGNSHSHAQRPETEFSPEVAGQRRRPQSARTPAVGNAVIDAPKRGDQGHVTHIDMPMSPSWVRSAMQKQ